MKVCAGMTMYLAVVCALTGCDRPPDWTDSHHIVHWIDGGETKIENLTLLCRRHHTLHHERGFRIVTGSPGRPRWSRPDGAEATRPARPRPRPPPCS